MCMHGRKMHVPYERMIQSSWGQQSMVKHQKPWSNCVCGPSIVVLRKLVMFCDYTSAISVLVYIQLKLVPELQKREKS
jgi:hypothetical protein